MRIRLFSKLFECLVTCAAVALAPPAIAQTTGSLSGLVLLDGTQPLAGATVSFNRPRKLARDSSGRAVPLEPLFSGTAVTGSDGRFIVRRIPVGGYFVCATGPGAGHLRSCDWGRPSSSASVTGTAGDGGIELNVLTGAVLTIAFHDPHSRIQFRDATGVNASQTNISVSANSGTYYYPARFSSKTGSKRLFKVAVPIGEPLHLFLGSALEIVDESGTVVPVGKPALSLVATDSDGLTVSLAVR